MKQVFFTTMFLAVSLVLTAANPFPQGFESVTEPKGEFFDTNVNFASIILADNPLKAGINTSDKVAAVDFTTVNSGIIKISFSGTNQPVFEYPRHPQGLDEVYYDVLRFKYYSAGKLNKNIEFEPNGSATSPKTIVQPGSYYYEEWAYVTIPLTFKTYSNFQIRVNRNAAGNGSAEGTVVGDKVYLDDFEMYNSIEGPISSVKRVEINNIFSCKRIGNGMFSVDAFLANKSNVRVDLISLDGRATTIFSQTAEGSFQVPFTVPSKGIYCVRMVVDNNYSITEKIISQ